MTTPTRPPQGPPGEDAPLQREVLDETMRLTLFADAYVGHAAGNATLAGRMAGMKKAAAKQQASLYMKRPEVRAAIQRRQVAIAAASAVTNAELAALAEVRAFDLTRSQDDQTHNLKLAMQARGMLSMKHDVEVKIVDWVSLVGIAEGGPR